MALLVLFIIYCLGKIDFPPIGVKPEDIVNNKRLFRIEVSTVLINKIYKQAYGG